MQRHAAHKRSLESAELLEASAYLKEQRDLHEEGLDDDDAGKGKGKKGQDVGVEKTKLNGVIATTTEKIGVIFKFLKEGFTSVSNEIDKHFEGMESPESVVTMKTELLSHSVTVEAHQTQTVNPDLKRWAARAKDAKTVREIKTVAAESKQMMQHLVAKPVKDLKACIGATKKYLATEKRKLKAQGETLAKAEPEVRAATPFHTIVTNSASLLPDCSSKSVFEAKGGNRVCLLDPLGNQDPGEALRSNACVKKAMKSCGAYMSTTGQPWAHENVMMATPAGKRIDGILRKGLDSLARTRMVLPDEDWAKKVYAFEISASAENHTIMSPTRFGCCEGRILLDGSETVCAIPMNGIEGDSLVQKRAFLNQMTIDAFQRFLEKTPNVFISKLTANNMVLIPSGFLLCVASHGSMVFRWSVSGDSVDSSRVRTTLQQLMKSYKEYMLPTHGVIQLTQFLIDQGL